MDKDRFIATPFYENIKTIISFTKLEDENREKHRNKLANRRRRFSRALPIDENNLLLLSESRERKSNKFNIRVIMRFGVTGDPANVIESSSLDDEFPRHLTLKINGKTVRLPRLLPYDRERRDGRRMGRPIDLTDAIMDNNSHDNNTHKYLISWIQDSHEKTHHFAIYLARRRNCQELTGALLNCRLTRLYSTLNLFTQTETSHKYYSDCEFIIVRKNFTTSLICPLSLSRINIPVRGQHCQHLQCFDFVTYLVINFSKPTWQCPICDKKTFFFQLEIDSLILSIINDQRSSLMTEIRFSDSGQWQSKDIMCNTDCEELIYFEVPPDCNDLKKIEKDFFMDMTSESETKAYANECIKKLLPASDWDALKSQFCGSKSTNKLPSNTNTALVNTKLSKPTPNNSTKVPELKDKSTSSKVKEKADHVSAKRTSSSVDNRTSSDNDKVPTKKIKCTNYNVPNAVKVSEIAKQTNQKNTANNSISGVSSCFLEKCKSHSKSFYSNLIYIITQQSSEPKILSFLTNERVPNMFRTTDSKMKLWILILEKYDCQKISEICPWRSDGILELHITKKSMILFNENNDVIREFDENTTWKLNQKSMNLKIGSSSSRGIFALEFREFDKGYDPKSINIHADMESSDYYPLNDDFQYRKSFLRKKLDPQKIKSRLIFLDAKFSIQTLNSRPSLLSVSIINYHGLPILNTLVTPRNRVMQFGEEIHDITEMLVRDKMDEYECLRRIHEIVKDKIIVGHNLRNQLNNMYIPKYQLMGIRDLSAAIVFKILNVPRTTNPDFFSLKAIENKICTAKSPFTKSYETVRLIWKIYKMVEDKWVDHNQSAIENTIYNLSKYSKGDSHGDYDYRPVSPATADTVKSKVTNNSDLNVLDASLIPFPREGHNSSPIPSVLPISNSIESRKEAENNNQSDLGNSNNDCDVEVGEVVIIGANDEETEIVKNRHLPTDKSCSVSVDPIDMELGGIPTCDIFDLEEVLSTNDDDFTIHGNYFVPI